MNRNIFLLAIAALALFTGAASSLAQSTTTVTATTDNGEIDGNVSWSWTGDCNPLDGSTSEVDISVGGYFSYQEVPNNDYSTSYSSYPQLFGPGSYSVTASWDGFDEGEDSMGNSCGVSGSSGTATATVAGPVASAVAIVLESSSIRSGQSVNVTIDVTGANEYSTGPTPTGTAVLFYQSTILKSGTLKSVNSTNGAITGGVTFTLSSEGIAPGIYQLTAVYDGDSNLTSSSSPTATLTITVGQGPSSTALGVSPIAVTAGKSVTLTATVTSSVSGITPTGTVNFLVGTTSIGTAKLNSSGVATLTDSTAGIPPGVYAVHASYGGDAYDYASVSGTQNVTVQAATATTLTASPMTVTEGQTVDLTAAVKRSQSSGEPTGTVAFQFAGYTFATTSVNGSGTATASISTKNLGSGTYPLTAIYNGDTLDATSTSSTVTVTVQ